MFCDGYIPKKADVFVSRKRTIR